MPQVLCQYSNEQICHHECSHDATRYELFFLIARGWRGTSLPRVSIRKEIQRHRCWAFLRKHGYSEEIHGGLIKKAQHRWRCPPRYVLTQGSLHYRLATLGYQKQNPYGVRRPHELPLRRSSFWNGYQKQNPYGVRQFCKHPLRPLFLLKWLSKAEGDGVRQSANILCAPSSFWNGYQKRKAIGFFYPAKRLCRRSPLLGEGLGVRL